MISDFSAGCGIWEWLASVCSWFRSLYCHCHKSSKEGHRHLSVEAKSSISKRAQLLLLWEARRPQFLSSLVGSSNTLNTWASSQDSCIPKQWCSLPPEQVRSRARRMPHGSHETGQKSHVLIAYSISTCWEPRLNPALLKERELGFFLRGIIKELMDIF